MRLKEISIVQQRQKFDIVKKVRLVPIFIEWKIDEYFAHFKKTALNSEWPKQYWSPLLQTVLCGKAQKVFTTLSIEDWTDYDTLRIAILRGYELVPEAYKDLEMISKRKGRPIVNIKEGYLERWCNSRGKDSDYEKLMQIVMIEEF